ncbi:MAG: GAF domain-containing protein, partial [Dehalococcoidia bacterium]
SAQTLVREDVATDSRFPDDYDFLKQGFHSSIMLPLICSNRVIGTLGARSHRVGAYGPREQAILERLAGHISPAVEGAKLYQQLKGNTEEMAALDEVARIITSTESFEEICDKFSRETQKLVRFDRLAINVVDQSAQTYTLRHLFGQVRPGRPVGSVRPLADTVVGEVVATGQAKLRPDIAQEAKYPSDQEYLKLGFHSSVSVPLFSQGEVIGTLGLHSRQLGAYGPQEQETLEHLAHQISHAVENNRLYAQIAASNEETAVVDEVARIITSTLDIDEVYEKFALEMKRLASFDQLTVNVIDEETGLSEVKYLFGQEIPEHYIGQTKPLSGSLTAYVMTTRQTLARGDIADDTAFSEDQDYLKMGLHSSIIVPLISTGRVIGTISFRCYRVGAYGPREQSILERLAYQIAHAMENSWLYEATRKEKERATTALAQLQALLDGVDSGICLTGNDYKVLWVNHSFCDYFGIPQGDLVGAGGSQFANHDLLRQNWRPYFSDPDRVFSEWERIYADSQYRGYTGELEFIYPKKQILEEFTAPVYSESEDHIGRLWVYKDITDRKQSEEHILQSQKIESVGRLAGGVAHDFNNLLMVIMGYSQLVMRELAPRSNSSNHLQEIQKAGERAANLTNQLLAFSRRQVIEPKVVNLNSLILNLDRMLRRLIGEDIELVTLPAPDLEPVKVDPGQMEQVLMNLAINARDAMPSGGKLVIETSSVAVDAEQARRQSDAVPGEYVLLSVTDTGSGMTEDTKTHLFEPFFTTKGVGEGTGLGLATCYGIIKQSGGYIEVESEAEIGTQFKIYLPKTDESPEIRSNSLPQEDRYLGTETVLLAEDEPSVRAMVATVLREQGYKVLEASNGDEALHLVQKHNSEKIDLLVTDVVMPKIGGQELAQRLHATRPEIKVLFTSGYAEGSTTYLDTAEEGTDFLQKPYQPDVLAVKVREVLDR